MDFSRMNGLFTADTLHKFVQMLCEAFNKVETDFDKAEQDQDAYAIYSALDEMTLLNEIMAKIQEVKPSDL